jgi:hypothetical protein
MWSLGSCEGIGFACRAKVTMATHLSVRSHSPTVASYPHGECPISPHGLKNAFQVGRRGPSGYKNHGCKNHGCKNHGYKNHGCKDHGYKNHGYKNRETAPSTPSKSFVGAIIIVMGVM